jgi:queuosine precursor transporter
MDNQSLFLGFAIFLLALNLLAFRMGRIYVVALIVANTLLMNLFVLKQFELFGFLITGGNALYGSIFLATDLLSEHYGKKTAQKAVYIGFSATLLFVVALQVLLHFVPAEEDFSQSSLQTLFSLSPRILLGSLLAFIIAQSLDVWIFSALKNESGGRRLWLRNLGSTFIAQGIDTLIFTFVGLTTLDFVWGDRSFLVPGVLEMDFFWEVFWATYIIKILVALLDTPFLYLSRIFKPAELNAQNRFFKWFTRWRKD